MKSNRKKIELLVRRTIESHGLLSGIRHVVIGFSGGPDSTALLAILSELAPEYGITPVAVYVDHGLRPTEVLEEIGFVRQTAQALGVSWETRAVGVREYAREKKLSLEHAARDLRYEVLRAIGAKYPGSVLAVAHNADDQAEEILLRLLRGSGRLGLSGMRYKNGDVIRPLLDLRKEEIFSYLIERGLSHCVDSSNVDDRFVRNRIRMELLPYLERRFDQGVRRALIKTASILAEDEGLLEQLADEAYQ
ncbi:MAG: tRNA lysidine(34) synthetase TilS, partial [Desulfobulbaceae bacterium]|nr:tRNA lysidine(34) synthetase TilS [Desulfobulbaceae bacterium]